MWRCASKVGPVLHAFSGRIGGQSSLEIGKMHAARHVIVQQNATLGLHRGRDQISTYCRICGGGKIWPRRTLQADCRFGPDKGTRLDSSSSTRKAPAKPHRRIKHLGSPFQKIGNKAANAAHRYVSRHCFGARKGPLCKCSEQCCRLVKLVSLSGSPQPEAMLQQHAHHAGRALELSEIPDDRALSVFPADGPVLRVM